ncbi:MtnX-like HAD-IB family phosphatase [Chloroflexota bacterium]
MIIQRDFDGTIATDNISLLIREKFAICDWQRIEANYVRGKLSVEESNKRQYALVKEPRDKLVAFAQKNTEVRAGFLEFIHYCQAANIGFVIVSSGLDFYIQAVLNKIGAPDMELHCGQTTFSQDGITVSYIGPHGDTVAKGFKGQYLAWLKQQSDTITYIGDGLSDFEAACAADYVFAIGTLHRLLEANSVSHYTFSNFHDIMHQISNLL